MHFFIDHIQLTSQASSNDGFGPSSADATNKYDVSANFQLASDAKAFACQPGHLIVTDYFDVAAGALDPDLVNVIVKPTVGLGVTFPTVKFYIYRGIKRDSFFTAGSFNARAPGNTDTVRKMWEDWDANVANSPDPLAPSDVGYDVTLAGTTQIEEIFGNTVVTIAGAPVRARQVAEGEWIGTFGFSKKICFEVIVEAELVNLNMEYARRSKVQIDISVMAAIPNPTPEQVHTLLCEKEKILAYVDPAALFGMHFSVGVSGFGLATAPRRDTLATTFLGHFSTATRVYIDIRSDKGYSYNFYENYGGGGVNPNLIKIKPGAAAAFVDDVYLNQGWPLFSQSGWTGPAAKVNLGLRLRIDDNSKPLLFIENTSHLPGRTFLDHTRLRDGAALDWSKSFTLKLDGSGPAGAKVCVATHVRLLYLKQKTVAAANTRLLLFNHRLDTVFGGIDLPIIGSVGAFRELRNEKVGLAEGADFAHVPDTGMFFDPDVALLYASSKAAHRTNRNSYPTIDFVTSTLDNVVRSPVFPRDIVFSRWSVLEGGAPIKLIDLSLYRRGASNTSIDGIHFLGLKRDELTRLKATLGFSPLHQRFLVFEETDQVDDNGFPYKRLEVKVQGLDATGHQIVVAPNPAVFVFGAGANMFCSSEFANVVNLPDVPPDPGMMKQWEHVFDGTYQRGDLSVNAVAPTGRVTVNDIGNDFGSDNPVVRLRARYFYPIDAAHRRGDPDPPISPRKTSYPLVVIVHANGGRFTDYDSLAKHLAHNGFIVSVVDLLISRSRARLITVVGVAGITHRVEGSSPLLIFNLPTNEVFQVNSTTGAVTLLPLALGVDFDIDAGPPLAIEFTTGRRDFHNLAARGRANVIFRHLEVLRHKFGAQLEDNIGLIGHSRGGEAVVRAAGVIGASTAPADLRNITAIISLAPTDRYEPENLTQDIPYFVMYGSRDGDVNGGRENRRKHLRPADPTVHAGSGGFSLYDRANNSTIKSMAFVYGANHNGFITASSRDPVRVANLSDNIQKASVRAYFNAFMRQHVLGEAIWRSYFTGEFIPGSVGTHRIFPQYKEMAATNFRTVDNFQDTGVDDWAISSSGEAVVHSRGGAGLEEGFLNPFAPTIDADSPHETFGLKVTGWLASDTLAFTVTTNIAGQDVDGFTHLSFRITQVARRANSTIDALNVVIEDATPHRFAAPLGRTIPEPDRRTDQINLTKSALMTVRIPLSIYRGNGVDLTKVKLVQFEFPAAGTGNIEIDDVEFTQ